MDEIYEEKIDVQELEKFRKLYAKEKSSGSLTEKTQFSFAWCLVRSDNRKEVEYGLKILRSLYNSTRDEHAKRDYVYYVAYGYTRAKEYRKALKMTKAMLEVEPDNHQVKELQTYILRKEKNAALLGLAAVGGAAAVAVGGVLGLVFALKKH